MIIIYYVTLNQTFSTNYKSLDTYGRTICKVFFRNVWRLRIDFDHWKENLIHILQIPFDLKHDWLDMQLTDALFPNIRSIHVENINLSVYILNDISHTFQKETIILIQLDNTLKLLQEKIILYSLYLDINGHGS